MKSKKVFIFLINDYQLELSPQLNELYNILRHDSFALILKSNRISDYQELRNEFLNHLKSSKVNLNWIITWLKILVNRLEFIVFYPTPYEIHYNNFWTNNSKSMYKIFMNYGITGIMYDLKLEFNLDFHANMNLLIANSEFEYEKFKQFNPETKVIRCNDPLISNLLKDRLRKHSKSILWAPHWTNPQLENGGWSNWNLQIATLHESAIRYPDLKFIVRAHPLLNLRHLKCGDNLPSYTKTWMNYSNQEKILESFLELSNVSISNNSLLEDLKSSSILLTDGISIIAYGLAAGCNVLISRRLDSPVFGPQGEVLFSLCKEIRVEEDDLSIFMSKVSLEENLNYSLDSQLRKITEIYASSNDFNSSFLNFN